MAEASTSSKEGGVPRESRLVRERAVAEVVAGVVARRVAGESVSDAEVMAGHPELMPQLAEQLAAAERIEQARHAAERAGIVDEPVEILGDEELNAPVLPVSRDVAPGMEDCQVSIAGYQMIGEISHGGQATVYKAIQEATGRVVAVKVLSGNQAATSAGRIRFEREVKHLANLSHRNIVGIIDRGRAVGGAYYLAMEFVDGPTLDAYFGARSPVQMAEVLGVFRKIARALGEAHRQGIIHRDLKPANVRIDPHGEPRLLDFGLARLVSEPDGPLSAMPTITLPNQIVGSVPWTSPEQVQGGVVDHRSDIYSFGFMLYYVIKGEFPFPAGNLLEALQSVASAQVEPLGSGLGALDEIVAKCMQRKPGQRYQSEAELIADLETVSTRPDSRWKRIARTWAVYVGIVVVGTASVCGVASLWPTARQGPAATERARYPARSTNSIGMELALCPSGAFLMGSPVSEAGRKKDETQHPVELTREFYMGRTEVTERQYSVIMEGAELTTQPGGGDRAKGDVTWEEAMEFCRRLSNREKRIYRLPTEAEWEYACRAGSVGPFASDPPEDLGCFGLGASAEIPAVASKRPNAWALYDMHGGVAEWCLTGYGEYTSKPARDPVHRMVVYAVARGGAWRSAPEECRSAARLMKNSKTRDGGIGFRVVAELP